MIKNLTWAEYRQLDRCSNSRLSVLRKSPLHLLHEMKHPRESDSMAMGSGLHCLILEPEKYSDSFAVAPHVDKRTKAGKDAWAEFEAGANGKAILTAEQHQTISEMSRAVLAHKGADGIVSTIDQVEMSAIFDWSGIPCKARFDGISSSLKAIIDVKTTRDANPKDFERSIYQFGYHRQAAFYLEAARESGLDVNSFLIIAVENEAPYGVAAYRIGDEAIAAGRAEILSLLEIYRHTAMAGKFPGYPEEIVDISIPVWALTKASGSQAKEITF